MSDTSFPVYMHYGTNAERLAFVPDPPASGQPIYIWYETDTGATYLYDSSWHLISTAGGGQINLSAGTTSQNLTNVVFSNSNGVSFGLNGSTVTAQHNGLTSQSNQAASAANGSFAFQTLGFSDVNGISFITSAGSFIAASHNGLTNINISVPGSSVNLSALVFSNGSGVTFGLDGSTITASVAAAAGSVNISAGTTSNNLTNLVFSNANNVTFGLDGSTITASASGGGGAAAQLSYFENIAWINSLALNATTASAMPLTPMVLPGGISGGFMRMAHSLAFSNLTFAGTAANSTFTLSQGWTYGVNVFSKMTGASSLSFTNVLTNSATVAMEVIFAAGAVGSNYSVTQNCSIPRAEATTLISASYACTSASFVINTSGLTALSGDRWIDVPFGSLTHNNYWLGLAQSSTSSNGGVAAANSWFRPGGVYGMGQSNVNISTWGAQGAATAAALQFGGGFFSTNSQFWSTNVYAINQLNTIGFNRLPVFQIIGR